jgi:hypothetical protein
LPEELTGKDWQRPDLQKRYSGYFSVYLARKIALLKMQREVLRTSSSDLLRMKKPLVSVIFTVAALAGMAGCAQIKKPLTQMRAMPTGLGFDQVGRVSMYAGEPCTPQIMFDFHGAGSTVWLAAPRHESKVLTDAAKKNRRVHVSGKWRHGGQSKCSYVAVTNVEFTR